MTGIWGDSYIQGLLVLSLFLASWHIYCDLKKKVQYAYDNVIHWMNVRQYIYHIRYILSDVSFNLEDHSLYRRWQWNIVPSSSWSSLHRITKAAQDLCEQVGQFFPGFYLIPKKVCKYRGARNVKEIIDICNTNNSQNHPQQKHAETKAAKDVVLLNCL